MLRIIFVYIALACLFFVLALELFFLRKNKVTYMSNQQHIHLFTGPIFLSMVFFTLAIQDKKLSPMGIFFILIFLGTYAYMLKYNKIILLGAEMKDVKEKLSDFLMEQNRSFRFHEMVGDNFSAEINNYADALIVRQAENWIEIDNHIHYDKEFVSKLDEYFEEQAESMASKPTNPNPFFLLLLLMFISLGFYFTLVIG